MKKMIIGYFIYAIFMGLYLFVVAPSGISPEFSGSAADPETFMAPGQLAASWIFSRSRHLLFFLSPPFEWLAIYFFMLKSARIKARVQARVPWKRIQVPAYYLMFASFIFLCLLPFRLFNFGLARYFGTSVMTLPHWLLNRGIDFVVDFILILFIIQALLFLMGKFKDRWWVAAGLAFIPFAFFFMLVQPVLIDPLYSDFYPLQDAGLEERIVGMAQDAGISAERVFKVRMSDRTNLINGYVTGVGPTARIVIWDTALEQLSEDEVLFLMAHEIAHYVYRDVYRGIGVAIVFVFGGLFILHLVFKRWDADRFKQIPLGMLTASMLMFAASPMTNAISRRMEIRADQFAMDATQDPQAGIGLFQKLNTASLNEVHPPGLVRFFRSTHPTIFERLTTLLDFE